MTEQLPAIRGNSPFKQAMLGGYDRVEVDEYVGRMERRLEELEQERSPNGAVQRALEQVGDEVAGILQRAHQTAAELTETARREADERLSESKRTADERITGAQRAADERLAEANREAQAITARAEERLHELDVDADRIWAERDRIISDVRELAAQLVRLADAAAARFPPEDGEATEAFDVAEIFDAVDAEAAVEEPRLEEPALEEPRLEEPEPEPEEPEEREAPPPDAPNARD